MATAYEGDDFVLDPEWERIKLVTAIREVCDTQIGRAAIALAGPGEQLESYIILAGMVEPLESDGRTLYRDWGVRMVTRSPLDRSFYEADLGLSSSNHIRHYNLRSITSGPELNQQTAEDDAFTAYVLGRTIFDLDQSEALLQRLYERRKRRIMGDSAIRGTFDF